MRRLLVPLGVAVTLALVAGGLWVWWVPHYRPSLRAGETYGIDVSHHQGTIDWDRVAADGITFAYIKATEGAGHLDERYVDNWVGAGRAGLDRGPYHFFTLCRTGAEQADNFLRGYVRAELPPAVDLELAGNCAARPDRAVVERELGAFLAEVEEEIEERVVLYLGDDWRSRYGVPPGDRHLWLRRVLRRPSGEWGVWQVQGRARVDGIDGPVDLNVMRARVGLGGPHALPSRAPATTGVLGRPRATPARGLPAALPDRRLDPGAATGGVPPSPTRVRGHG